MSKTVKLYNNPLKRFFIFLVLCVLVSIVVSISSNKGFLNLSIFGSLLIITLLLYFGLEIFLSLIANGNFYVIAGFIILLTSVITFAAGLWEKGQIYKPFIVAVAAISTLLTFNDLLKVSNYSPKTKKVLTTTLIIFGTIFVTATLMITEPTFHAKINKLNTDYLTFIALGIAVSTMGLRQQIGEKKRIIINITY
jgi:hypothetical protein